MAEFESTTNKDCEKCHYCQYIDMGGGDYSEYEYWCEKMEIKVTFKRHDDKPCKLPKGKYFIAKVSVKK